MKILLMSFLLLGAASAMAQGLRIDPDLDDIAKGSTISFKEEVVIPAGEYAIKIADKSHHRFIAYCMVYLKAATNYSRVIPANHKFKIEDVTRDEVYTYKFNLSEKSPIKTITCRMTDSRYRNYRLSVSDIEEYFENLVTLDHMLKIPLPITEDCF